MERERCVWNLLALSINEGGEMIDIKDGEEKPGGELLFLGLKSVGVILTLLHLGRHQR